MAQPNPEEEIRRLDRVLANGIPRVIVLLGKARWFRDRALEVNAGGCDEAHVVGFVAGLAPLWPATDGAHQAPLWPAAHVCHFLDQERAAVRPL